MKINIWRILHTWRWPCRPKHVVKDSETQHNKAARRRKHNLQYPLSAWSFTSAPPVFLELSLLKRQLEHGHAASDLIKSAVRCRVIACVHVLWSCGFTAHSM
jgi:hypothetical protein